jgi:hypothetical protein
MNYNNRNQEDEWYNGNDGRSREWQDQNSRYNRNRPYNLNDREYFGGGDRYRSYKDDNFRDEDDRFRNPSFGEKPAQDYNDNDGGHNYYNPSRYNEEDYRRSEEAQNREDYRRRWEQFRHHQPHYNYYESYPSYGQSAPYSDHERSWNYSNEPGRYEGKQVPREYRHRYHNDW